MSVFTHARLVLPDQILHGSLRVQDGLIDDIAAGSSQAPGAIDLEGDFLIPGAIDLHTDNLERQVQPRSNARWPGRAALLAHDAHCAAAGITTVFDSLCVGDLGFDEDRARTCREGIADLTALAPSMLLKAEHFLHLRCELPAIGMIELMQGWATHPLLRLVSLMDHTPGVGQYSDLARYRRMRRGDGEAEAAIEPRILALQAQRAEWRAPNRAALLALLRRPGAPAIPLASHDDRLAEEIAENRADGIAISEFPVTHIAAQAARASGMAVIAGAPNLVRGGSHTGNVAVEALLRTGLVDALASDYVPASLVHAAFIAADLGVPLPQAITLISAAPAHLAGLQDRGRIAPGLRADLARIRLIGGMPVIRQCWRAGTRII